MIVQQILNTGHVDETAPTDVLESAKGVLEFQISELKQSQSFGAQGALQIQKHTRSLERIEQILRTRRGLDDMTPLAG